MMDLNPTNPEAPVTDAASSEWDQILFALYLQELQEQHGPRPN